jgi:predicted O-methyltransferase YrrM
MTNQIATEILLQRDTTKSIIPFGSGRYQEFAHTDTVDIGSPTGIAIQEGELLYGLTRILLPKRILETGTNIGISTSYMALGCEHNGFGTIDTIEHNHTVAQRAQQKFKKLGFENIIKIHYQSIESFTVSGMYDLVWLDSELSLRYGELLRFWPNIAPGAIICIHDLWCLEFDEFKGVPPEMKALITSGDLRAITIQSDHGVTIFQKRREFDHLADIQNRKI